MRLDDRLRVPFGYFVNMQNGQCRKVCFEVESSWQVRARLARRAGSTPLLQPPDRAHAVARGCLAEVHTLQRAAERVREGGGERRREV